MKTLKYIKYGVLLGLAVVMGAWVHYSLPTYDVVWITKTMERLEQREGTDAAGNSITIQDDVYFISTIDENNKERVYRNEDIFWYFKFDSTNLDAKAERLKSTEAAPRWVAIQHYGWRITLFSMYPNAISISEVAGPGDAPFPIMMVIGLVLVVVILFVIFRFLRRLTRSRA